MAGDSSEAWWTQWDPANVTLTDETPDNAWKACVLQGVYFGENEYNGQLGGRISAIFVILVTSLLTTTFPVVAARVKWLRIPNWVYMIARNFGSGVIIATAFIHLMDPSYDEIGGNSCVGQTGNWAQYPFNAAMMLAAAVFVFIVDAYCDFFADVWYGVHDHLTGNIPGVSDGNNVVHTHSNNEHAGSYNDSINSISKQEATAEVIDEEKMEYYSQFAGFLVLEFGILFHSVMIGLNLGVSSEYATLYPVLVFHQAFEGLGVGARLANIPFPPHRRWIPWVCCAAYALTTPITVAIGLGVRTTYRDDSFNAQIIQGVLDSLSAGILFYTGFVELLGRDFIFNPNRTKNVWNLTLQLFIFLWGAGLMALLGKWA